MVSLVQIILWEKKSNNEDIWNQIHSVIRVRILSLEHVYTYMFTKLTPSAISLAFELFLKSQILGMFTESTFQLIKMSNYLLIQNSLWKKLRLAHILGNRELNFYFMVENS